MFWNPCLLQLFNCSCIWKPLVYMKIISSLKKLEIQVCNCFVCLVETFGATHAPQIYMHLMILFWEIMNQITYLKWVIAICKSCQFINLRGNIQFFPFESIDTQSFFVQDITCLSKRWLVHDTNVHKIFSALNLTIIFIKCSISSNVIFSVSFLNEVAFFH